MGEEEKSKETIEGVVVFDLEANGFLREATVIHCIAARHLTSRQEWFFGPDEIQEGVDFLSSCEIIVAHNGIGYDFPLLKKLYPTFVLPKYEDSVILSRLFNPDRAGHSIEDWGKTFGQKKPEHTDWTTYSDAMGHRCIEDTRINTKVLRQLIEEMGDHDWEEAIRTEYNTQWLQNEIEDRGVRLSDKVYEAADYLDRLTSEKYGILSSSLPLLVQPKGKPVLSPFVKSGALAKRVISILGKPVSVGGPFCGVEFVPLNLNSSQQLNAFLYSIGWEPTEFNYKKAKRGGFELNEDGTYVISSPKVTEDSLEPLDHPVATHLKDWRVLKHRLSILNHTVKSGKNAGKKTGWVNTVRDDGRVEARAIPCGTNTHRYTHQNIVNLPSVGTAHSEHIRSMLVVSEGMVFAGTDAAGIQARLGGHYAYPYDGGEYARELLEGDIHSKNAEAFTDAAQRDISRQQAKNIGYALSFGARTRKIATMMGCSMSLADELIKSYWDTSPGLAAIVEKCTKDSRAKGYLIGLDGRPIFCRSPHSSFNALLQSAEAVFMKNAFLSMKDERWPMVMTMHDEWLCEMDERYKQTYVESTQVVAAELNEKFEMNIPMEFDTAFGMNYAECH